MENYQKVFKRVEKKYMLSNEKYDLLISRMKAELVENEYPHSQIVNIYYDTDNFDLAINSISKPTYKEKVRLRSYGDVNDDTKVFLELKRKCLDVVTKRRIALSYKKMKKYIENKRIEDKKDIQICNEINYAFSRYNLLPKAMVAYDRDSFYLKENEEIRITFDRNLRYRLDNLELEYGDDGTLFFDQDIYIMEIKTCTSIPMWLVKILNELKVYPISFSKYGEIYKKKILQN